MTFWYCDRNSTLKFEIEKRIPRINNQNNKIWKKFKKEYQGLYS